MKSIKITLAMLIAITLIFSFCGSDDKQISSKETVEPSVDKDKKPVKTEDVKTPKILSSYAIVSSVKGNVLYSKDENAQTSRWKEVRQNLRLRQGDWIQTKDNAKCILSIGENNTMMVDQNSKINIAKLMLDGNAIKDSSFTMKMGKLLARTKNISSNGAFTVRTPSAVAGVRGTEFLVEHDSKKNISKIFVSKGKIAVTRNIRFKSSELPEIKNFGKLISRPHNVHANQKIFVSGEQNKKLITTYNSAVKEGSKFSVASKQDVLRKAEIKVEKISNAESRKMDKLKTELDAKPNKLTTKDDDKKKELEKVETKKDKDAKKDTKKDTAKKTETKKDVVKERKEVKPAKKHVPKRQARTPKYRDYDVSAPLPKGYRNKQELGNQYKQTWVGGEKKQSYTLTEKKETHKIDTFTKSSQRTKITPKKFVDIEEAQKRDLDTLDRSDDSGADDEDGGM